jgi:hypothetical protein
MLTPSLPSISHKQTPTLSPDPSAIDLSSLLDILDFQITSLSSSEPQQLAASLLTDERSEDVLQREASIRALSAGSRVVSTSISFPPISLPSHIQRQEEQINPKATQLIDLRLPLFPTSPHSIRRRSRPNSKLLNPFSDQSSVLPNGRLRLNLTHSSRLLRSQRSRASSVRCNPLNASLCLLLFTISSPIPS